MLRSAIAGDEPAIAGFLERHAETSMFLRSNLHRFGLFDRSSPNGTAYWLAETNGDITAVFGLSNAGMVMSEAPAASPELWQSVAHALDGQSISGIAGEVSQVAQAKQALGLHSAAFGMDSPEPLYKLSLDALILPDQPGEVRVATEADRPLLQEWQRAYITELHMATPERAEAEARSRTARAIASGTTRILLVDGIPVAMTALNAELPDMVQIGGVYTPPALRRRGYARQAVALHLDELRGKGVTTAILFASGDAACRAYEAIGFQRIGTYALSILKTPIELEAR